MPHPFQVYEEDDLPADVDAKEISFTDVNVNPKNTAAADGRILYRGKELHIAVRNWHMYGAVHLQKKGYIPDPNKKDKPNYGVNGRVSDRLKAFLQAYEKAVLTAMLLADTTRIKLFGGVDDDDIKNSANKLFPKTIKDMAKKEYYKDKLLINLVPKGYELPLDRLFRDRENRPVVQDVHALMQRKDEDGDVVFNTARFTKHNKKLSIRLDLLKMELEGDDGYVIPRRADGHRARSRSRERHPRERSLSPNSARALPAAQPGLSAEEIDLLNS